MKKLIVLAVILISIVLCIALAIKPITGQFIRVDDNNVASVIVTNSDRGIITTTVYEVRLRFVSEYNPSTNDMTFMSIYGHKVEEHMEIITNYTYIIKDSIQEDFEYTMKNID